jgi:hypothetical protein
MTHTTLAGHACTCWSDPVNKHAALLVPLLLLLRLLEL